MTDRPWFGKLNAMLSAFRFGQFASVGLVGAVLDTSVVIILTTEFGVYRGFAKLAGAELAIITMFLLNEHWTFADEGATGIHPFLRRLGKSNLVRVGGVLVATVVFVVVSGFEVDLPWGGVTLWLTIANAIGIAAGFIVNYIAESLFTWRVGRGI